MCFAFPLAITIDYFIGDPQKLWGKIKHPVTWMAGMLMFGEKYLNRSNHIAMLQRFWGLALILGCGSICFVIAWFIEASLMKIDPYGVLLAILISIFLAFRSLIEHVVDVSGKLENHDIINSRLALSKIVGRDTRNLNENDISRASIETLAENFSDGFIAPLFWALVAGLPGIVTYKMINTADSMIGNKSERFINFGWGAARIDDVVNFIPARLTALFFAFAALFIRKTYAINGFKVAVRDHCLHASLNAGWPEAAMAGILDVKLGGPRTYQNGTIKDNNWLGFGRDTVAADISTAINVVKLSWFVILLLVLGGCFYASI